MQRARGTVTVLGDDELNVLDHGVRVIARAVNEHDHVRVLLDRARLAQIGELRLDDDSAVLVLLLALFHVTRHLREQNDGDFELFGDYLHAARNIRDFLLTGRIALFVLDGHQLQIVYHHEIQPALALFERAALMQHVLVREVDRVVYVKSRGREPRGNSPDLVPIFRFFVAFDESLHAYLAHIDQNALGKLARRHFQVEGGYDARRVPLDDVGDDVERERRLSQTRAGGDDDYLTGQKAVEQRVQIVESRFESTALRLFPEDGVEAANDLRHGNADVPQLPFRARGVQVEKLRFGKGAHAVHVVVAVSALDNLVAAADDGAQHAVAFEQGEIIVRVRRGRHAVDQRFERSRAAHRVQLALAVEPAHHADDVHRLPLAHFARKLGDGGEDLPVRHGIKIVFVYLGQKIRADIIVEQHAGEDRLFRLVTVGHDPQIQFSLVTLGHKTPPPFILAQKARAVNL